MKIIEALFLDEENKKNHFKGSIRSYCSPGSALKFSTLAVIIYQIVLGISELATGLKIVIINCANDVGFSICRGKVCSSKRKNSHPVGRSLYLAQLRKRAYIFFFH